MKNQRKGFDNLENHKQCPRCGWLLSESDDYNGDGFATCACGVSVDLDRAERFDPRKVK